VFPILFISADMRFEWRTDASVRDCRSVFCWFKCIVSNWK